MYIASNPMGTSWNQWNDLQFMISTLSPTHLFTTS